MPIAIDQNKFCSYRPQLSCGKVMFLHLFVILFIGRLSARHASGQMPPGQTSQPRADAPPGRHRPETANAMFFLQGFWRVLHF